MKKFRKAKSYLLVLMLFIITAKQMCLAQDNPSLITSSSVNYDELNDVQKGIYDNLASNENSEDMFLVQLGELNTDFYSNGEIKIILPFLSFDTLIYGVSVIEYESDSNYRWGGNIKPPYFFADTIRDSTHCFSGSLTLVSTDGRKYGWLSTENERYLISDLTGGIQVMIRQAVLPEDFEINCSTETSVPPPDPYTANTDPCLDHKLRILVFYTPAADGIIGYSPTVVASQALTQMQVALSNSGAGAPINLEIAGVLPYYLIEQPDHIENDIGQFATDDNVFAARDNNHADLCVLFTNGDYNHVPNVSITTGKSYNIGPDRDSAMAAIVDIYYAADPVSYTFCHEVGHLFGAHHDADNDNGAGGDPNDYGHGYHITGGLHWHCCSFYHDHYHDIMSYKYNAYSSSEEPVIQYYSNPNVDYLGSYATGSDPYAHSSAKFANNGTQIEEYNMQIIGGVQATIDAQSFQACDDYIDATAIVTCGSDGGGDAFQWYVSTNGINYYAIDNTASFSFEVDHSHATPFTYFFKCIIINPYGTATVTMNRPIMHPCPPRMADPNEKNKGQGLISDITLIPNPANNEIALNIKTTEETMAQYELFNSLGLKIRSRRVLALKEGINNFSIDISELSSGPYYFKIVSKDNNFNIPFIVIH